jgi:hypothetical protein
MSKGGLLTSFSNGYVIKTDGSSMKVPTIELDQVTKEQYVPTNFARDSIKVIEDENISLRQSYETQIQHLTTFYTNSLEGARNHYESLITEAKSKGLRHVEIQKQFKKEMEEQLKSEISNLEINVEQLRDSLAELSLKYQEQTREYNSYVKKSENLVSEQLQKIDNLQIDLVNLKEEILNDKLINKECSEILNINLNIIEINERNEILSTIEKDRACREKLNMEIFDLNSEKLLLQKHESEQKIVIEKGLNNIEILEEDIDKLNTDIFDLNTKITYEEKLKENLNSEINNLKNSNAQQLILIYNSIVDSKLKSTQITNLEEELRDCNDQYIAAIVKNCINNTISSIVETTYINNLEDEIKQKINVSIQDESQRNELLQEEIKLQHSRILEYEEKLNKSLQDRLQSIKTPRQELDIKLPEKVENASQNNPSSIDFITGETSEPGPKSNDLSSDSIDEIKKYKTIIQELEEKLKNATIENKSIITESIPVTIDSNATPPDIISSDELNQYKAKIHELEEQLKESQIEHHNSHTINKNLLNVSSKSNLIERQALQVSLDLQQTELAEANIKFNEIEAKLQETIDKKNNAKFEIKKWADDFTKQNGRAPGKEDKAQVREKYYLFQTASTELKNIQSNYEEIKEGKAVLDIEAASNESKIKELDELISDDTFAEVPVKDNDITITNSLKPIKEENNTLNIENSNVPVLDMDIKPVIESDHKLIDKPVDNVADKFVSLINPDQIVIPEGSQIIEISCLEALDDQIYQLKQKIAQSNEETEKLLGEKTFLTQKLEEIIKEKRSDVLKSLENQIETLMKNKEKVSEEILSLKIEDGKKEMKLQELKERAETAESDLKDITENNDSNLKITIGKQRNEIVLKSKATTAGWDAAADAEEKLEIAEAKARLEGIEEYKKLHENDTILLHNAIEEKEVRITELMVNINKFEKDVLDAENKCLLLQQQVLQAQEDASEAFAQFGSGGDGGGVSSELLDQARDDLNQAQEEYIEMTENYENILQEKELGDKKIEILEKLLEVASMKPKVAKVKATKAPKAKPEKSLNKSNSYSEIPSILLGIKNAIVKGTSLWKSNLRDDCYSLYLTTAKSAIEHLKSNVLRDPLNDSIHSAAKQSKPRGAVILRKSFDRLISDAQNSDNKKLEEIAYAAAHEEVEEVEDEEEDDDDESSPQGLQKSLTEALLTLKEESIPASKDVTGGDESHIDKNKRGVAENLLKRAQAAEKMVEFLKNESLKVKEAATKSDSSNSNPKSPTKATSNSKSEVDPSELRRLQRQIKSLETALSKEKNKPVTTNSNNNSSVKDRGNDRKDPIADKKALIAAEKVSAKKIKDLETSFRKEKTALEARIKKAESGLESSASQLPAIIEERDLLKFKVREQVKSLQEMEILREKADQLIVIQNELNDKNAELSLLSVQFTKESALRKKYKNELEDLKGAIRVYARCRPVAKYEIEKDCKVIVDLPNETSVQVQTSRGEKDFEFDAAFNMQSTQDEVFEDTKRLVESCLDGFNVCIFAYGQTGSGKTFTMTGSKDMPGITPKSIAELFRLIKERKHCKIKVSTYFVELYNDNLVDLYFALENKKKHAKPPRLDIKVDSHKMVFINNVVIKEANDDAELMDLFTAGNLERHTGATKMNAESSRSHSIFSILVESFDTTTKKNVIGKLSIVDLAGSERADKTGAGEERLKEAQNINKSLSALGDVISALSEGAKFIPYRNNKLTQVMQDSLGGNAKTLMFVNFSPVDYNADETITSLNYATRVKKIVNNASKQADNEEVARLKAQIKELQLHGSIKNDNEETEEDGDN